MVQWALDSLHNIRVPNWGTSDSYEITQIHVREGDTVKAGDKLVSLRLLD